MSFKRWSAIALCVAVAFAVEGARAEEPSGASPAPPSPSAGSAPALSKGFAGTVVDTIVTGGYVYVQVDTGSQKLWAAAPEQEVKVGDRVRIPPGAPMANHHSNTLNRTFDLVYFVGSIFVGGAQADPHAGHAGAIYGHPAPSAAANADAMDLSGIAKAEGGLTVAEIFEQRNALASQQVAVRGKVVKVTQQVMGRNWVHLRDGTASAKGENDLTVTTDAAVAVGDTVLVRGTLAIDRDFGFGYRYDAIVENASATVE